MNANAIINDDMTLEEKLSAIDAALKKAQEVADEQARKMVLYLLQLTQQVWLFVTVVNKTLDMKIICDIMKIWTI